MVLRGDTLPAELVIVDQSNRPNDSLAGLTPPHGSTLRSIWSRSVGLCWALNEGIGAAQHDLLLGSGHHHFGNSVR